jgi:hypothetical protein
MFSKQKKSKGLTLVLSAILGGLFAIAIMGLLYWLFLTRILEMHVAIDENTNERHAINLANVLISSEKIVYEKEGKIMRGILDVEKLNSVQPNDIGIGYSNSISVVRIVDLEKCSSPNNCEGWIFFLSGPVSLEGLSLTNFYACLSEHVKLDIRLVFRGIIFGWLGLWQPLDLKNCAQNTAPSTLSSFFSKSQISSEGLPILIRYPTGELHAGRILVAVGEWI